MDFIIGIDPGKSGAVALVYQNGCECEVWDMPEEIYFFPTIWKDIEEVYGHPLAVYIELAHSMPGQGVSSTFKYGTWYGAALLWAYRFEVDVFLVPPRIWKRGLGLKKNKSASLLMAQSLYPEADIYRMKDILDNILRRAVQHGIENDELKDAPLPNYVIEVAVPKSLVGSPGSNIAMNQLYIGDACGNDYLPAPEFLFAALPIAIIGSVLVFAHRSAKKSIIA